MLCSNLCVMLFFLLIGVRISQAQGFEHCAGHRVQDISDGLLPSHRLVDSNLAGYPHRRRKGSVVGGTMASAEHEPITGVWGQSPQRGPGAEPLVRGAKPPPEAESILVIAGPTEPANLAPVRENTMFCYGPLVSELGGPRVHGAPRTPSLGGRCPPAPPRVVIRL